MKVTLQPGQAMLRRAVVLCAALPIVVMTCSAMGLMPTSSLAASGIGDVIAALSDLGAVELELFPLAVIAGAVFFGWRDRVLSR